MQIFRCVRTWYLVLFIFFGMAWLPGCKPKTPEVVFQQPKVLITPENMSEDEKEIINAFQTAIEGREDVLSFLIFDVIVDHIDLNETHDIALVWLSLSDPLNSEVIPMEAGLAIAQKVNISPHTEDQGTWKITLQADADWDKVLSALPDDLLDVDTKANYRTIAQPIQHAQKTYSGYRLPWAAGESKYLTGSIGHVYLYKTCPRDCLYAFDFGDGTMWAIHAAKGGRVRYAVWQYPNGNTKHANYIVIEDTTTSPTTYQVYLHLAQDSIPVELRTPGAVVVQGQKIGAVDDTGVSTGHHLHFHVHTNPGYYWGTSVDITFDDVKVNGGRPRTCYEARLYPSLGSQCQTGNSYISGNNDNQLPTGGISSPSDGAVISDQILSVSGWAKDDTGIGSIQIVLTTGGEWQMLGELMTQSNFTAEIDLCEAEIPDGNFFIALKITDKAGKQAEGLPGIISLQKKFTCPLPPPQCQASANQVALFEEAQYQGGCIVLDSGTHSREFIRSSLGSIGSIQVGENVITEIQAISTTIPVITSTLDTNDIGLTDIRNVVNLSVSERPPVPSKPAIFVGSAEENNTLTNQGKILISWDTGHTSYEYRCKLLSNGKLVESTEWVKTNQWIVDHLEAGDYQLYLDVRNILGSISTDVQFSVAEADLPPAAQLEPMPELSNSTAFKIKWQITEGINDIQSVRIRYQEDGQGWQLLNQGFPPQISETWFIGKSGSQYRFEISAIDLAGNEELYHPGTRSAVQVEGSCLADNADLLSSGNDTIETSAVLELNIPQEHNFCPENDQDWFSFIAEEGAVYSIDVTPVKDSSAAAIIRLFNFTIGNPIAEIQGGNFGNKTHAVWAAPNNGIYYIQVSPIDTRLAGTGTGYTIELKKIVQVHTPSVIVSTLIIPVLWALLRLSKKIIRRTPARK